MTLIEKGIKEITLGSTSIGKVYLGSTKVRPAGYTPTSNTVAYLKLESNTNDSSGNGNNGTGTNISYTTLSTGKKVATFGGSSIITFNNALASSGSWTYIIRAYGTFSSGGPTVIMGNAYSDRAGYYLDIYGSYIRSIISGKNAEASGKYSQNTWMCIASTFNGSTLYTYLNGTLIGSTSASIGTTRNFYMGYRAYGSDRYWSGYMSELICENRVRTATELSEYYTSTKENYGL